MWVNGSPFLVEGSIDPCDLNPNDAAELDKLVARTNEIYCLALMSYRANACQLLRFSYAASMNISVVQNPVVAPNTPS